MTQTQLPPATLPAPSPPGDPKKTRFGKFGPRSVQYLAMAILMAFLGTFLIWPIALAIWEGFTDEQGTFTFEFLSRALGRQSYQGQMLAGLGLAICTTLLSLLIALPPAILRARYRFAGQGVLGALMLVPMILPPFVGALSMRHLFSQYGAFNLLLERIGLLDFAQAAPPDWLGAGFSAVVVLQALHLFPILYLNCSAALASVDPAYQQAAVNLGASPLRTFWCVTLPLIRPGIFAGGTIVFIWSLTDIGTPLIVGYEQLLPVTIFKGLATSDTTASVFSLVFVLLNASILLYVMGKFFFGRSAGALSAKASSAAELRPLGFLATGGAWLMFGGVLLAALLPHVGVILTAVSGCWVNTILPSRYTLEHLSFVLSRADTFLSIKNSLLYASLSTACDLLLGGLAAWLIVRSRLWGKSLLDAMVMLPLAVPGLILAAGYLAMTASGPLSTIGPAGEYVLVILVIAYTVRRLPFAVRGISAGLEQVPISLVEAAQNLGASPARAARLITLPLITANIIAAGVLTFAFAVLEVSDSLVLAQRQESYPITKELYEQATSGNVDAANIASALGVYGMALLGGTLALASALMGKKLGAIFRA